MHQAPSWPSTSGAHQARCSPHGTSCGFHNPRCASRRRMRGGHRPGHHQQRRRRESIKARLIRGRAHPAAPCRRLTQAGGQPGTFQAPTVAGTDRPAGRHRPPQVIEGGEPVVVPNQEGRLTTPSVVAFLEGDRVLVGDTAKRCAFCWPLGCAGGAGGAGTKTARDSPRSQHTRCCGRASSPQLSYATQPPLHVVITIPTFPAAAQAGGAERQQHLLLRQATHRAGL